MYSNLFYRGIFYTCIASFFWGLPQPIFFNELSHVPSLEVALHRGLWSFILLFIMLSFFLKFDEFIYIFYSIKKILILSITACLISINWTSFIFAVSIEKIHEASMGYFITPIITIVLGYFFLNERITKIKMISLTLMTISIILLIYNSKIIPFLPILIGTTWGIYNLLRKKIDVSPATGLLYESFFISIIAIPALFFLYYNNVGFFFNYNYYTDILLIMTGLVTIFPLFLFNLGVKYIPLGLAGVLFYLAPTFHFITSYYIFDETIPAYKLVSFIIIWIGVCLYIYDSLKKEKLS